MFKFFKPALFAAALLFAQPVFASDWPVLGHAPLLQDTDSHTYTHILGLEPIPNSYQLAKATFLPDAAESVFGNRDSLDKDYNTADCADKSSLYTTKNCTYPRAVVYTSKCPFAPGYYKECACLPQFKISSCTSPKILSSPTCNGKAASCICPASVSLVYTNDRCTQYCDGNCIAKSCTPTASETGCKYGTTSASNNCGGTRTVCKPCNLTPCSGISSKPANSSYTTSSCTDCSGTKTINTGWSCNSGYHQSGSSCVKDCTPATNETGCSYGTYSCSDGCGGTRTCCSACSKPTCSGISSKPSNSSYTTASCTDCSGTRTINTGWSCNSGYHQSGSSCVQDKAAVGDILYSDMTTSSSIISGKTPIGVVFDPDNKKAAALTEFSSSVLWSTTNFDIPSLPNYPYSSKNSAMTDNNGKQYTKIIYDYCTANGKTCQAAVDIYNYSTAGTSRGTWYLGDIATMNKLFEGMATVNSTITRLGKTLLWECRYATSIEASTSDYWAVDFHGFVSSFEKSRFYVCARPIINY